MVTASGFKNRLLDEAPSLGIEISKGQAAKIGIRLARRLESQMIEFDFYEGLRILGVISDPTARDAVKNVGAGA